MQLTAVFLLLFALSLSAKTSSQPITLSGHNIPMEKIFAAVEKQTGYVVVGNKNEINQKEKVTVNVTNLELQAFLALIFSGKPYTFEIKSRTIFLRKKTIEENKPRLVLETPKLNIRGKVINAKNEPIPGASVRVKNASKGTLTNENGEFSLNGIDENSIVVISSVQYETREMVVTGSDFITIQLSIKTVSLEEVAVSVSTGYQQIAREKTTGSFSLVDNKLLNRSVSPDILSRLKGVVAGVLFDQSAANNIGISIRGRSTIYANTQPLIILNNQPFQGVISDINPNDVESISILKDAAASSMWGALSGNGVIVITTKKGRNNQPVKLSFNSNITIREKPDLFYNQQFMDPGKYIDLEIDLFNKGWYNGDLAQPVAPPVSPVVDILDKRSKSLISAQDSAAQIDALRQNDIRRDYSKYFYRPAVLQQYYLSLTGGNDKSSYYVSGAYDKELETVKHNNNDRTTLSSQVTFIPVKNLEVSGNLWLSISNTTTNGISSIMSSGKNLNIYPYAQLADNNGNPVSIIKDFGMSFVNNLPVNGLLDWSYIPLNEHLNNNNKSKSISNRLSASAKYNILPSLSVQGNYLWQSATTNRQDYSKRDAYDLRNLINRFSQVSGGEVIARRVPLGGRLTTGNSDRISNSGRLQLNYFQNFSLHNITAMAGVDAMVTKYNSNRQTVYGYDDNTGASSAVNFQELYPTYPYGSLSIITGTPLVYPYTDERLRSYFSNLGYSYNNKYYFTFNAKVDQSNLFGVKTNQKSTPLWSVGGRWNISQEQFYSFSWLPILSLRTSYGYNGNFDNSMSAFSVIEILPGNINMQPYAYIVSAGNPRLKWEKIGIWNIAFDFQLKKDVVNGTIEYYRKKGVDMIGNSFLPSSSGFESLKGNYSRMKANGVDLTLNTQNIRGKITWSSNLVLSYTNNEITKNEGVNRQLVGRPVQSIYAYRWGGLDPLTGDPIGYLADTLSKNYRSIIREASNDPTKYVYAGPSSPRFFGGFRNSISWKWLSVSANIIFKTGYYFQKNTVNYSSLVNFGLAHKDYENRWQSKGDEARTNIPSFVFPADGDRNVFFEQSEINVEKADHIRLQDINISCNVIGANGKTTKGITELKIYAYANNLGIIWKANKKGIDPDFTSGYVVPRSYSIGLNMTFNY